MLSPDHNVDDLRMDTVIFVVARLSDLRMDTVVKAGIQRSRRFLRVNLRMSTVQHKPLR